MNKKGYFMHIPNLMFMFFVVLLGVALITYQNIPESSPETFQNITWKEISPQGNSTINLLVIKFVNFVGDSAFIISKEVTTWAYHNQNIIDGKTLMTLLILMLVAPLIYPVFIITVSLILITREYFANRREKRNLEEYNEKTS